MHAVSPAAARPDEAEGSQVNFLPVGRDLEDLRATFFTNQTEQVLPAMVNLDAAWLRFQSSSERMLSGHD